MHALLFCGYNRSLEVKQKAWGLGLPFGSTKGKRQHRKGVMAGGQQDLDFL